MYRMCNGWNGKKRTPSGCVQFNQTGTAECWMDIYRTCSAQTEHVQYVYRAKRTANVWLQVMWRTQWRVYKLAGLVTLITHRPVIRKNPHHGERQHKAKQNIWKRKGKCKKKAATPSPRPSPSASVAVSSSSSNICGGIRMKFVNDWESSLRSSTISWSYRPNCRRRSGLSQALDHHLLLCHLLPLLTNTWACISNCALWRCSCACKTAALYCTAHPALHSTGVRSGMRTEPRAPLFILHRTFGPCPVLVLWVIVASPVLILYLFWIHSVFIRFSRFVRWLIRCQYCTYVYYPA